MRFLLGFSTRRPQQRCSRPSSLSPNTLPPAANPPTPLPQLLISTPVHNPTTPPHLPLHSVCLWMLALQTYTQAHTSEQQVIIFRVFTKINTNSADSVVN